MTIAKASRPSGLSQPPYDQPRVAQRFSDLRSGAGRVTAPRALALALVCGLSACSPASKTGFAFAAASGAFDETASRSTKTQARFAQGAVTLVAPAGHCIDTTMLRHDPDGGFVLLPRCNLLQGGSLFGRNRAAVITATIGPAGDTTALSATDLAQSAEGAKLLYYDDKGLLPLVRLQWPGHSAMGGAGKGASAEHWRGAFVLNNHLVLLALYAPEGSVLLGPSGAEILTEMTRRSLAASAPASLTPDAVSSREAVPAPAEDNT
ncbi:hypothetical protein, partial [Pseudophaeobacter sp.]|uniref:hypothetical protein n=1 Tax=Pseudophaeobacter sp. TaxID=1971739 RepID=UPI0032976B8E